MPIPKDLVAKLQQLLWAPFETRRELQQHGLNVVPANFYSTVPSIDDLESTFESQSPTPYLDDGLFDAERMATVLDELAEYARELDAPGDDDADAPKGFFWNNGQFGYSDAASYYAFLRARKPNRVLEIGAGFSTLVASAALAKNGRGDIVCIEPFPRPFLAKVPHVREIVQRPAQTIDAAWVDQQLADGDVLFIDSTHTVKIGSDCLHIYLRLLPRLQRRLLVHVHDVFLPAGMPPHWARDQQIYWTEQYLLLAYLLDNPKVRVLFGSNYHRLLNPASLARLTPSNVPAGGGSFWFERTP